MPWHTDACHRFPVIVRGQQLTLEFREAGERMEVAVHPGMVVPDVGAFFASASLGVKAVALM